MSKQTIAQNERASEILNSLLNQFESGNIPDAIAVATFPPVEVPSAKWSLGNRVIQMISGTADARGFQQWKNVGRSVKKGAKAIYILGPRMVKTTDKESGEPVSMLIGFMTIPVFRVEDTEGEPLSYTEIQLPELPLAEVADAFGVSVRAIPGNGSYLGFYRPSTKEIALATPDESTFFHELAHAAHHRVLGSLKGGQDWKQEIVAELSAAVLMRMFGRRDTTGNHYTYIRSYAEKSGKNAARGCLAVLADVQQVLDEILQYATVNA